MEALPFKSALDFIAGKLVDGHAWDSGQWAAMESDVRARAFFSANVENARFLDRSKGMLVDFMTQAVETVELEDGSEAVALKVGSRADFVRQMRELMMKEGMLDDEELEHIKKYSDTDVTELGSRARLKLIFDTNVRSAWGYGHWKQGMSPAVLKRYPAARFIRVPGAREPRVRHLDSEGDVRLKWDDGYWATYQNARDIGGFEVPWAPYGFHSYMEQEDVSRSEAERLGLMKSGEEVPTADDKGLNANLKASTKTLDPEIKRKLLENLQREEALNGAGRQSATELARDAGRKARMSAIERSLQKARGRGDSIEVARIEKVLMREKKAQQIDAPVVVSTPTEVKVVDSSKAKADELESLDDFKQRLLDSEAEYKSQHQDRINDIERLTIEKEAILQRMPKKVTRARVGNQAYMAWVDKYNRWYNEFDSVNKPLQAAVLKQHDAGLKLIALPTKLQGAVQIIGKRPTRGQKAQGLRLFEQVVHKDLASNTRIKFKGRTSRSYQIDRGTHGEIAMNSKRPPSIVAHEIMHQTEIRHLLKESRAFLKKRAGAERPQSLQNLTGKSHYDHHEVAYEDEFHKRGSAHYAGKLYGLEAKSAQATELLTIGIERLLSNPIDFLKRDEEYFTWIVKLIQKRA